MKELNIGRILTENRRKRGITQEELAEYMGVSKASVSKWENAVTYPDITLLPRLATYFNISIDELMGYEPQMTKADIRKLYQQLCRDFSAKPFDEVMEHCRQVTQKYFSCAPLLFEIGSLYVNHCMLAGTPEGTLAVLEEAAALFIRVREESEQASLADQAVNMQALCLLQLGRGQEVIELLTGAVPLRMAPEPLLAEAFRMTGDTGEAARILQAGIYQTMIELVNLLTPYIGLCGEASALMETCRRLLAMADIFRLETLQPGMLLTIYLSAAQALMKCGEKEQALDILERYGALATSDIYPLRLHGDSYFSLLDGWLEENLPLGSSLPRDEALVRKDILNALTITPVFAELAEEPRFQAVIRRLENAKEAKK